jgi:hypothetical protein
MFSVEIAILPEPLQINKVDIFVFDFIKQKW